MLTLEALHISKQYNQLAVIHDFSHSFKSQTTYGIIGSNGSGKSTLLKILAGYITPQSGTLSCSIDEKKIAIEQLYRHVSFMAPYIDLIDDFTLRENMEFHFAHKKTVGPTIEEIMALMQLPTEKRIKDFSSGMKQKLKLTICVLSDSDILIIDEPGSFLDQTAKTYFQSILQQYNNNRLTIIASNEKNDLESCEEILNIENYKKTKSNK